MVKISCECRVYDSVDNEILSKAISHNLTGKKFLALMGYDCEQYLDAYIVNTSRMTLSLAFLPNITIITFFSGNCEW